MMARMRALVLLALFVSGCATAPGQQSGPSFQDTSRGVERGGRGGMGRGGRM
jgi:PBP1b-binding outer membrane lipoprotein LpoB